jgi:hypothetical protein
MEVNLNNRGAKKRGGRPRKEIVEARPEPVPLMEVPLRIAGCVCPCCGRAMVPKVLRGTDLAKTCVCTLCAKQFNIKRASIGATWYAQPLR